MKMTWKTIYHNILLGRKAGYKLGKLKTKKSKELNKEKKREKKRKKYNVNINTQVRDTNHKNIPAVKGIGIILLF